MKIAVIGAGPAGLMAAASVENDGHEIIVFDKNEKSGKKLYITGKGRCNFTNSCTQEEFLSNVVSNPKFLYSAIYGFGTSDAIAFIEKNGCASKTERGGRVFPVSDKASDVTKALVFAAKRNGAEIWTDHAVSAVKKKDDGFELFFSGCRSMFFDKVIIATGGQSYPSTGSTGDGYRFADSLGHSIVKPMPSLCALNFSEKVQQLAGLSLKNVEAELKLGKKMRKEFGEVLFTHNGVSGPIILSLSAYFARSGTAGATLKINLKPALTREQLDKRILRDFDEQKNKQLKNSLDKLLPKSLISFIIDYAKLDGNKPVSLIEKNERVRLLDSLTCLEFEISESGGFGEAIITSGGIDVKEINPSTMESKLIKGLFFAGEVIDIDALTGGFNIQIALSTGWIAGKKVTA